MPAWLLAALPHDRRKWRVLTWLQVAAMLYLTADLFALWIDPVPPSSRGSLLIMGVLAVAGIRVWAHLSRLFGRGKERGPTNSKDRRDNDYPASSKGPGAS